MDLPTLKSTVKAWEKAFRAREGRTPTKDDIKQDPTGISEKYTLYRRLTKQASQSSSQSQSRPPPPSSSSASAHASSSAGPSRQTPRTIPSEEYPTTPTPKSRRANSGPRNSEASSSARTLDYELPPPTLGKRAAPDLKSPSSARLFTTPKKPRPSYSGPVHDPNPINPFSASPARAAVSSSLSSHKEPAQSPFLHASSPRKLKELLESNSLRKVKERQEDITPRSKARLRLTGEFVTPMKDKQPKRRRGEAPRPAGTILNGKQKMEEEQDEKSEEDEFGPSPARPGLNRTFTELLQAADESVKPAVGRKRSNGAAGKDPNQRDILGFFGKTKSRIKLAPEEPSTLSPTLEEPSAAVINGAEENDILEGILEQGESDPERLSTPPLDPELQAVLSQDTPSKVARAEKVFTFSDDEEDEWDPEGGNVRRRVVITGTRRQVARRGSLSSEGGGSGSAQAQGVEGDRAGQDEDVDDEDEDEKDNENEDEDPGRMDEEEINGDDADGSIPTLTVGETATSPAPSSPRSTKNAPMPLLSLLSLRSPGKSHSDRLNDLRVKAIFNPSDAVRLKASQRGQDIYVSGEGINGDDDEDGVLDSYEFEGVQQAGSDFGDDDWEEEPEGWKKTQAGMDDW